MTNDGNAILREITVQHPAAKSLIEIARTQDEEVGDGTTSVIILAGEMLAVAEEFLTQQMHPTVIIRAYRKALDDLVSITRNQVSLTIDVNDEKEMRKIVSSCIGTKFISGWSEMACDIALRATKMVTVDDRGRKEIDIKRYAKIEKIPGGSIDESRVIDGVMFNKDIVHPKMRRRIENPRIVLLDCNLEYKKGESQTDLELMKDTDFARILELEELSVKQMCDEVLAVKPDLVITEKGVSDLAQHFFVKAGVSVVRRLRKTDNNRVARVTGATIVNRTDELREEDVGLKCHLFEIQKIGDEYFTYLTKCDDPKACTILLRGASKDVLNEVERNLQDALHVTRNVLLEPKLMAGGGASEMAIAHALMEKSKELTDVDQWPYKAVARALEVIPRTLIQNCGGSSIRTLTALRAKHATPKSWTWGVNGETGAIVDMNEYGVWDPISVKLQTYKTAIETAMLLLRIDDIVSGTKKQIEEFSKTQADREREQEKGTEEAAPPPEMEM